MRRGLVVLAMVVAAVVAVPTGASAKDGLPHKFTAELSGAGEVPPVVTDATGSVKVQIKDGVLKFGLKVANIDNVTGAHIHCGAAGVSGPVGVTLFAGGPTGPVDGTLAKGHIWAPNAGNACGWVDLWDVLTAIRSGDTYVNVHSTDVPSGEIRGQLG